MKQFAKDYYEIAQKEINDYIASIDYRALEEAAKLILDSEAKGGRVHTCGIGKPSYVAGYIASLLSSTGTKTYVLHGTEAVHGSSGQVAPGDVVIAISNSGETVELRATVETLINNGAHVIAVTGNKDSWLSQAAALTLVAGVKQEGDTLNKPPRASILAETLILQGLSVILQEHRGLDPLQYVTWHPGGALGASIKK
ncbi:MAG: SIS domain-containing protein [Erysipelothrix sp.]|nr:SIS domain-containing protein [Erysipelothrix sp.]